MPRKNTVPRALSLRQAQACENGLHPRCRCRCGGTLHGAKRAGAEPPGRAWFAELAADDPHRIPSDQELRDRRNSGSKRRRRVRVERELAKLESVAAKWSEWHGGEKIVSPYLHRRLTKLRGELATL